MVLQIADFRVVVGGGGRRSEADGTEICRSLEIGTTAENANSMTATQEFQFPPLVLTL